VAFQYFILAKFHNMSLFHSSTRFLALFQLLSLFTGGVLAPVPLAKGQVAGNVNPASPGTAPRSAIVDFVDTSFENASPLWYAFDPDGTLQLHLLYDHERSSPNRAAGHFHLKIVGQPHADVRVELNNLENVWNGTQSSVARELKAAVISEDGVNWQSISMDPTADGRVGFQVNLGQGAMYVARVEPYRISDLNRLLERIQKHPAVKISKIGSTHEGRDLEIIQIGSEAAAYRIFLRARAHPWEAGGNWVLEGLIARLLQEDDAAVRWRNQYCVYILPMANKDGVARGRTRFNLLGKDLNRNWDKPAAAELAPENAALEGWLVSMIERGLRPHLAIELHNDGNGQLHISRPPVPGLDQHLERMMVLESLLRRYTWFTEGSTKAAFRNSGTLGDGWLERFGVDALVHEFNCNWIAGLEERPQAKHWKLYGEQLALVFEDYLAATQP
jgi:hypothetical protein